jgi:hypothetical protein
MYFKLQYHMQSLLQTQHLCGLKMAQKGQQHVAIE